MSCDEVHQVEARGMVEFDGPEEPGSRGRSQEQGHGEPRLVDGEGPPEPRAARSRQRDHRRSRLALGQAVSRSGDTESNTLFRGASTRAHRGDPRPRIRGSSYCGLLDRRRSSRSPLAIPLVRAQSEISGFADVSNAPRPLQGDPTKAGPWIEHVRFNRGRAVR